jgi:hypothetical protein
VVVARWVAESHVGPQSFDILRGVAWITSATQAFLAG